MSYPSLNMDGCWGHLLFTSCRCARNSRPSPQQPMKTLVLGKETQRFWVDFVEMQQSKKKDLHSPKFSTSSLISCFVFFESWIRFK